MMLEIITLGRVEIRLNGVELRHQHKQRALLLALLAEKEGPQPRRAVAELLWPYADEALARNNLRGLLFRMRQDGFGPFLVVERRTLALNPDASVLCDLVEIRRHLAGGEAKEAGLQAVALYNGPFLAGLSLSDYPVLAEWADSIQYELEAQLIRSCLHLLPRLLDGADYDAARHTAALLLELTPYNEEAQLLYLEYLLAQSEYALAQRSFRRFERTMREEFPDWSPSAELNAMGRRLADPDSLLQWADAPDPLSGQPTSEPPASEPPVSKQSTTQPEQGRFSAQREPAVNLIGRQTETAWLEKLLNQGERLITIGGMGGIGKTTFLLSRVPALHARFNGRVVMVDLRGQMLEDTADPAAAASAVFLNAVANGLDLQLQPGAQLITQIRRALTAGPICLLLENFETVQPAAVTVTRLLENAPELTVLITSRQLLNIKGEAQLLLGGLTVADGEGHGVRAGGRQGPDAADVSEAADFFLMRARQTLPPHVVRRWDSDEVEQFCRQMGGHPLALELAALQLDFYTLEELAALTAADVNLLATDQAGHGAEHASLNRLLDTMWSVLSSDARRVLAEVSVFAGAFHRNALQAVAPAPLTVYRELRDAALLQAEPEPAWFSLHPLVRQAAARRLAAAYPESEVRARHARFILGQIDLDRWKVYRYQRGPKPDEWRTVVRHYAADVLVAWRCAAESEEWAVLADAVIPLGDILRERLQIRAAIALIAPVVDGLPPSEERTLVQQQLAGRAALMLSWLHHFGNDYVQTVWCERAIDWLQAADLPWELTLALIHHTFLLRFVGQYRRPMGASFERSTALIEAHDFQELRGMNLTARLTYDAAQHQWGMLQARLVEMEPYLDQLSDSNTWNTVFLAAMESDDWALVDRYLARFVQIMEMPDGTLLQWVDVMATYFRANLALNQGQREAALAHYRAIVADELFTHDWQSFASFLYGQMALWEQTFGDQEAAQRLAEQAAAVVDGMVDPDLPDWARLQLAAYHHQRGDRARAAKLCLELAARWRNENRIHPIFVSSLYLLARLYRAQVPEPLFLQIVKLGAVSPGLHYTLRFLARDFVIAEGIGIGDEEREAILTMDPTALEALLDDVARCLSPAVES